MEKLEEKIKLRSITGGCFHKASFVFHIEHDGKFYQYTKHHLNASTINLRLVLTKILGPPIFKMSF